MRPVLEYASSVWDPSTKENIDKLEQIQKRAARFITGEYSKLTRITPLVKSLNLETLEDRRTKSKVVIIHKAINSNLEIQHKDYLIKLSDRQDIGIKTHFLFRMQEQTHTNSRSSRPTFGRGMSCLKKPGKPTLYQHLNL